MSAAQQNMFLESTGRLDERGFATHIKRHGGTRPRDLNGLQSGSRPTSTSNTQFSEGLACRESATKRQTISARSCHTAGSAFGSQSGYQRKTKPLLSLTPPNVNTTATAPATAGKEDKSRSKNNVQMTETCGCSDTQAETDLQHNIGPQSLEERFHLEDLRRLMRFFSVESNPLDSIPGLKSVQTNAEMSGAPKEGVTTTKHVLAGRKRLLKIQNHRPGHFCSIASSKESSDKQFLGDSPQIATDTRNSKGVAADAEEDFGRDFLLGGNSGSLLNDGHEAYTRVLTEQEFVFAVMSVIRDATEAEIKELMKKVDYEAKGRTTWDDFATYLVSQSRHMSQFSSGSIADLVPTPEPEFSFNSLQSQHITGTCMETDTRHKLLLTGGSEGSVRAWDIQTLQSSGVIFSGDCWIVGIHCSTYLQCIFIVTMERKLFVLDSKTLDVKRLYRGRAVVETVDGYLYAHDSVEHVGVGGMCSSNIGQHGGKTKSGVGIGGGTTSTLSKRQTIKDKKLRATGSTTAKFLSADSTISSSHGINSFSQCRVEECILAGLVDAVSCSLFHHSLSREDVLLFATVIGEVRFYAIPRFAKRVLFPYAVIRLHEKRINKMSIVFEFNALLTASNDGTVKMTSLENGALLRTFSSPGHEQHSAVHSFAVNVQQRLLVTVGPERYGMVWDFAHDLPGTILDSHSSPCRSCAVNLKHSQIFTSAADGSVFVFTTQGFRLTQVIHVPFLIPQCITYDEERMRLVCLAGHPYYYARQRQVAATCSNKYEGHMATMLGVLYNKTYDSIITIDVEGFLMTWNRCTGAYIFSFYLKDFSDSAVMNASRITCYALDGLERRLLTGFQNGAVAVWNVVNGQTTNVITAAAECFANATTTPEVTALGSLMREGITFFFFAVSGHLFCARESNMFTIATAIKWEVPSQYGEILSLFPTSQEIVVCGTSSGALFFYHFLAERQTGSALCVMEFVEKTRQSLASFSDKVPSEESSAALTSRVVTLFPLRAVGAHILMVLHADGTVALWHTLRKMLMETLNLRYSLLRRGNEVTFLHANVDSASQYFVFVDMRGNVYVCSIRLRPVCDKGSLRSRRLQQLQTDIQKSLAYWPGSPFNSNETGATDIETEFLDTASRDARPQDMRRQKEEHEVDEEKLLYVFSKFSCDYVFNCGFSSVSGIAVINTQTQPLSTGFSALSDLQAAEHKKQEQSDTSSEAESVSLNSMPFNLSCNSFPSFESLPPTVSDVIIVVSSGADNFTRVFSLDGTIIGECGMNQWTLGKKSTYNFLGVREARKLSVVDGGIETTNFLRKKSYEERYIFSTKLRRHPTPNVLTDSKHTTNASLEHSRHLQIVEANADGPLCLSKVGCVGGAASSDTKIDIVSQENTKKKCTLLQSQVDMYRDVLIYNERQEEKEKEGAPCSTTAMAKKPSFDGKAVLSTRIASRRLRDDCLLGLVKNEFIPKLRGLPLLEMDNESSASRLHLATPNSTQANLRSGSAGDTVPAFSGTYSGVTALAGTLNSKLAVISGTNLPDEYVTPLEMHKQGASGAMVIVGDCTSVNHQSRSQTGSFHRSVTVTSNGENDPCQCTFPLVGRQNVGFDHYACGLEENYRAALMKGHMEAQRRMLRSLGGSTAERIKKMFLRNNVAQDIAFQFEEGKKMMLSRCLTTAHQFQKDGVTEARSHVAQITSRLRVFPLEPMKPPKGSTHETDYRFCVGDLGIK